MATAGGGVTRAVASDAGQFGRGVVNGLTFGLSELVRQDVLGDDPAGWSEEERLAMLVS